jgi:hypothetical protein
VHSCLSRFGDLAVRIIEANVTCVLADGTRVGGRYRLATTLLDPVTTPLTSSSACCIRHVGDRIGIFRYTLMAGQVLRSGDFRMKSSHWVWD